MTKIIQTKYIGPANTRGSRIRAGDGDGNSVTISYDDALSSEKNHGRAAADLLAKMGWTGTYVGGHLLKAGKMGTMVWVCSNDSWTPTLRAVRLVKGFEVEVKTP